MISHLPLLTLYLSERCNSRCISCDYWRHGSRDLELRDIEALLPDMLALGTRSVLISGGEPLLNREWQAIASLLKQSGIELWLLTSGLQLARYADAVASLFCSVTVSLDGTSPQTYAAIRGVNAFGRVLAGIRAACSAGVPTSLRVTLQRANFRELDDFVTLARELGVQQISFLAVDVGNRHAFARQSGPQPELALDESELSEFGYLIDDLESCRSEEFRSGFIAESPERLRRIRDYFAALLGQREFPVVRCNAPDFSAVVGADGSVSPCFFIPGHAPAAVNAGLATALNSSAASALRDRIRARERPECERCVCSMWRDPATLDDTRFRLGARAGE